MTDATNTGAPEETGAAPKSRKGLLFGLIGAIVLGGAGFYAISSGLIDPGLFGGHGQKAPTHHSKAGDVAFVPMEPIMISLPPGSSARHLRFTGNLEVDPARAEEVAKLMPRILDVLNTYLRAVEVRDLEQASAVPRLRAQMLRRVQVVTGEGQVRDLLISEFILN